jgi:hypothetical protein
MSTQPPSNPGQGPSDSEEEEEAPVNWDAEIRIGFQEGYYRATTGEIRRAKVEGARVLWYECAFDTFVGVELRSAASGRRILGELTYLPNYVQS